MKTIAHLYNIKELPQQAQINKCGRNCDNSVDVRSFQSSKKSEI